MKKNMNYIGMLIILGFFILFYVITTILLDRRGIDTNNTVDADNGISYENNDYKDEEYIVNKLYQNVRILYDVVNNKFKVSQDETIVIGDITYKKITNFEEITSSLFTSNGVNKYVSDLGNYFAYTNDTYYLAGNLVSYQTYYFRGDETNIYVIDANDDYIKAIIYEKWTSNNKNTLASIRVVKNNNDWLIDNIDILATE